MCDQSVSKALYQKQLKEEEMEEKKKEKEEEEEEEEEKEKEEKEEKEEEEEEEEKESNEHNPSSFNTMEEEPKTESQKPKTSPYGDASEGRTVFIRISFILSFHS